MTICVKWAVHVADGIRSRVYFSDSSDQSSENSEYFHCFYESSVIKFPIYTSVLKFKNVAFSQRGIEIQGNLTGKGSATLCTSFPVFVH